MGSGHWSAFTCHDRAELRTREDKDVFDHSASAKRSGILTVHQTLDPRGLTTRESRDSDEHPTSNAIVIGLDVTGSMDRVVRGIHGNLPKLHELLLGHNYIAHPQILFAAVGDATCDRVPLQADLPLEQLIAETQERYSIYYIIPGGASHGKDKDVLEFWHRYLGSQRVILLDQPEDTSQCIALTIGVNEGTISMDEGLAQLQKKGVIGRTIDGIAHALSGILEGGGTARTDRPRWL